MTVRYLAISLVFLFNSPHFYSQQVRILSGNVGVGVNVPEPRYGSKVYRSCMGEAENIRYCSFLHNKSICFKRSENGGKDWLDSVLVFATPSPTSTMVNGVRVATEPRIACDLSKGAHQGRIYICWSDLKNGKNNLDVFLAFSDDKGKSWTEPILITYRANHKHQFSPEVQVDPEDGKVYLLFFDQQNYLDEKYYDLHLASSMNGGLKFEGVFLNQKALKFKGAVKPQLKQSAEAICVNWEKEQCCAPAWACARQTVLPQFDSTSYRYSAKLSLPFELFTDCALSAELTKPLDAGFRKMLFKGKKHKKGKNLLELGSYLINLPEDNYILTLYNGSDNAFIWILSE